MDHLFLAYGDNCWGTGPTPAEAKAKRRQHGGAGRKRPTVLLAPVGVTTAWLDQMGYLHIEVADGFNAEELIDDAKWIKL